MSYQPCAVVWSELPLSRSRAVPVFVFQRTYIPPSLLNPLFQTPLLGVFFLPTGLWSTSGCSRRLCSARYSKRTGDQNCLKNRLPVCMSGYCILTDGQLLFGLVQAADIQFRYTFWRHMAMPVQDTNILESPRSPNRMLWRKVASWGGACFIGHWVDCRRNRTIKAHDLLAVPFSLKESVQTMDSSWYEYSSCRLSSLSCTMRQWRLDSATVFPSSRFIIDNLTWEL